MVINHLCMYLIIILFMIKAILLFAILAVCIVSLTDKQIMQENLNGLYRANFLDSPKTIMACFDDDTAHRVVVEIGQVLEKAARGGSSSDLTDIIPFVKDFIASLPQPTKDCVNRNTEVKTLAYLYGIDESTDMDLIEKKVFMYIVLHYLTYHKWAGQLNIEWKNGQYYQVGFEEAGYAHQMLSLTNVESDKDTHPQFLHGLLQENGYAQKVVALVHNIVGMTAKKSEGSAPVDFHIQTNIFNLHYQKDDHLQYKMVVIQKW